VINRKSMIQPQLCISIVSLQGLETAYEVTRIVSHYYPFRWYKRQPNAWFSEKRAQTI